MKRIYELKFEYDGGEHISCTCTNEGFNSMEIVGLLESKILDIHQQIRNAELFEHKRIFKDGEVTEEIKEKDETKD